MQKFLLDCVAEYTAESRINYNSDYHPVTSMKKVLKSFLDKAGYAILSKESISPKDLRDQVYNPLLAKYYARKALFLINADFKNCIAINRFSCEKTGNNPLVNVVTDYLKNRNISYSGSKLERFYDSYKPKNVAEMFNLKGKLHENLVQLNATFFVLPWDNLDMKTRKKVCEKIAKIESKRRGNEFSLDDGSDSFGPISKELGELKIKTLVGLVNSIKEKGYIRGREYGKDILASVLVDDQDYKYLILDGTHRLAVLSALDYKWAPVRVHPPCFPAFIYRKEVDYWPNVKKGLYTRDQALKIFDCFFKGVGSY